jgi:hypothetical protein
MAGGVQAAAPQSQINVKDQDLNTGVIVLDSVVAPQDGWVVVYKSPNFTIGDIVGYAPVRQGVNTNVKVTIATNRLYSGKDQTLQPTLWARLHVDNDVKGLFEWGLRNLPYNDPPVVENGHQVIVEFGTSASQATASTAPAASAAKPVSSQPVAAPTPSTKPSESASAAINVATQALNSGVMHVDSVTAPQDGWVVVYKNPNFTSGGIVGYAPVHQGVNTNVPVTIDTRRVKDLPGLWIMLQADNGTPGLFEWGLRNLPYDDQPVSENGHPVVAGFAITDVP